MMDFDYTKLELFLNVHVDIEVEDDYQLNQTIHSLHLNIKGHPEHGEWKRYLHVLFTELRRYMYVCMLLLVFCLLCSW